MFSSYEEYLNYDFSPDYWSDEGITAASSQLGEFSDEDWEILARSWMNKPKEWKIRCAETIDSAASEVASKVLLAMLQDVDADVVIAAADSLRSMAQTGIQISQSSTDRLMNLREQS